MRIPSEQGDAQNNDTEVLQLKFNTDNPSVKTKTPTFIKVTDEKHSCKNEVQEHNKQN